MKDFFICHTKSDKQWALGLDGWLCEQGYSSIVQEYDFLVGGNFMSSMHHGIDEAARMILVLSPDVLDAKFAEAEWTAKLATDPTGEQRLLIPVRVRECQPPGLLRPIPYIDLVGLSQGQARSKFINEVVAAVEGQSKARRRPRLSKPAVESQPTPPAEKVQNIYGHHNTAIFAGKVTINKGGRKPKSKYPEGSVGANIEMYAYTDYLVDRYNDWRADGLAHYGDRRAFHYTMIHQQVKKAFGVRDLPCAAGRGSPARRLSSESN